MPGEGRTPQCEEWSLFLSFYYHKAEKYYVGLPISQEPSTLRIFTHIKVERRYKRHTNSLPMQSSVQQVGSKLGISDYFSLDLPRASGLAGNMKTP